MLSTSINLVAGNVMGSEQINKKQVLNINIENIKKDMALLNITALYSPPPSISAYFNCYHLNFPNCNHSFGKFTSNNDTIAAHIFLPQKPKGTIFLLHGYYDHTGILKNLIRFCLNLKFAVAVYDLQGHGLSSGDRFSINDFSEYTIVLNDFINLTKQKLPKPFHLISHSTGSSIVYDYLNTSDKIIFKKVIFLAPLVHSAHWKISKLGYYIVKPFFKTIPRRPRKNSSDPDFLKFMKNDPLQKPNIVPIKFLTALYNWNKRIEANKSIKGTVMIIQGADDVVVDWKYNRKFFTTKIDSMDYKLIENANHQLVNEKLEIRKKVFNYIKNYIECH